MFVLVLSEDMILMDTTGRPHISARQHGFCKRHDRSARSYSNSGHSQSQPLKCVDYRALYHRGIWVLQGSKRKLGSTGFYGPVYLGRYWSVTSRHWSVYLQYLDRVADVKKQRIMLYKLF